MKNAASNGAAPLMTLLSIHYPTEFSKKQRLSSNSFKRWSIWDGLQDAPTSQLLFADLPIYGAYTATLKLANPEPAKQPEAFPWTSLQPMFTAMEWDWFAVAFVTVAVTAYEVPRIGRENF
jgi:hypothetical protein